MLKKSVTLPALRAMAELQPKLRKIGSSCLPGLARIAGKEVAQHRPGQKGIIGKQDADHRELVQSIRASTVSSKVPWSKVPLTM